MEKFIHCEDCKYHVFYFNVLGSNDRMYYCNNKYGYTFYGNQTYLSPCGYNRELFGCSCGKPKEDWKNQPINGQLTLY